MLSWLLIGSGEKEKLGEKAVGSCENGIVEKGAADDDKEGGW